MDIGWLIQVSKTMHAVTVCRCSWCCLYWSHGAVSQWVYIPYTTSHHSGVYMLCACAPSPSRWVPCTWSSDLFIVTHLYQWLSCLPLLLGLNGISLTYREWVCHNICKMYSTSIHFISYSWNRKSLSHACSSNTLNNYIPHWHTAQCNGYYTSTLLYIRDKSTQRTLTCITSVL